MNSKSNQRLSNTALNPIEKPAWQSPFVWVIALILLAGVAAIFLAARDRDTAAVTNGPQTAPAEITGTPLAAFATPDPALGSLAPGISAQTLEGEQVEITADGTARLYGFFAHWCPHCQRELPITAEWLNNNELPASVEVVAISTAVDSTAVNYPPSDWFTREQWPATVLIDDAAGSLATGYGLSGFPYWVAVDGDGKVVQRVAGALSVEDFESLIAEITPTP